MIGSRDTFVRDLFRAYIGVGAIVERRCKLGRNAQASGNVSSTMAAISIIILGTPAASLTRP
jgi:hypothetical protein